MKRWLPLLLLFSQAAVADCTRPPNDGWRGNYASYAAWCRGCGGTPYNSSGVGCNPGSSWGKGSSVSGAAGFPGGFGFSPRQQLTLNFFQAGINFLGEIMKDSPEELAARQEQLRAQAEQSRLAAEAERQAAEARHRKLEKMMKGFDTPQLLRVDASEGMAPGHRIVDCEGLKTAYARLREGLDGQRTLIEKTERQLVEAQKDSAAAAREWKLGVAKQLFSEARKVGYWALSDMHGITATLEKLRLAGKVDPQLVAQWKQRVEKADKAYSAGKNLYKAELAGIAHGERLSENAASVAERLDDTLNFFVNSGLAEKVGEKGALAVGGPIAAGAFRGVKTSLEAYVTYKAGAYSEEEAAMAKRNANIMREQLERSESRIKELSQDLCDHCDTCP